MKKKELNGRMFDAMTDAKKAKVIAEIEAETPQERRKKLEAPERQGTGGV